MAHRPSPPTKPTRVVLDRLPFELDGEKLPRGLRLFGVQLDRVRTILGAGHDAGGTGPASLRGHALYRAGLRTPLFMLEGLARVARGTGMDRATIEEILADIKAIEDALGEVDFWWVTLEKGTGWQLPPELLRWAQERHLAASGRVAGWLEARGWVDHRYLPDEGEVRLRVHRVGARLGKLAWPGPKRERRELLDFLHKTAENTHRVATSLDLSDVEQGLHELRRRLRWLSIYAAALDGAIQLDPGAKPPAGWERYLTDAVVNNPFNALPRGNGEVAPILLPAPLFYALSWLIAELGAIKDRAQWTETVSHGLAAAKLAGEPRRWLGDAALDAREAGELASAISKRTLLDDSLLPRLAQAIDAQR